MLDQQLVLITGASRGLGAAIALAAHREGARVVINYFQSADAAQALQQALGERAIALQADVHSADQVQAMVQRATAWAGRPVTGLVHNALVQFQFNGDARPRLDTLEWQHMQDQLDGALRGALNTLQACHAGMQAAGGGSVVHIGTNLFQHPVVPYHDYTAAKGALLALTRTAAKEWGPQGIRVNTVSGGLLRSTDASAATPEAVFDLIAAQTPLQRVTTPEEMADAVVMLLSPLARGVTGQNLVVDGGLVMD